MSRSIGRKLLIVLHCSPGGRRDYLRSNIVKSDRLLAESIGLFDDPVRIGFRNQWNELVASKGYMVVDQQLKPVGNVAELSADNARPGLPTGNTVDRHLTALSRSFLSAPVQALLRHNLIRESRSFFDYGCGKGDDIEGVRSLGISAAGWDPHFRTDATKQAADVVNIGFVINVIEDMGERIEALQGAYALTHGVLSVSAMLWLRITPHGDQGFRGDVITDSGAT